MFPVAGTAPRAPITRAEKISVSRPIITLNSGGTTRMYSTVFCRSPELSFTPRMFGTRASFATVSTPIVSPPHVAGVELAVRPEHENGMHAVADQVIQKPPQPRQVEVLVVAHRRRDRGDDAVYVHRSRVLHCLFGL